ncbi:MAG: DMT family transporter [Candidatus Marinimicrobia bacterium]|nr:DMT family transporter [Candidatus Neomarinimicrobiota bacterium]
MKDHRSFTILLIAFQALIIGFTNIASKQAALELDPFVISFFRYIIGIFALGSIVLIRRNKIRIDWSDWKILLFLLFMGMSLNQILFAQALKHTIPSHPPMIYALTPIVIIFIDIIRKRKIASRQIVFASILSFIGVGIVLGKNILILNSSILLGDGLIFIAMLCWSLYTAFGKSMVIKYGSLELTLILLIGAAIIYSPWGIYRLTQADLSVITWKGWISLLYLGIFTSGMAYLNYFEILKRIEPTQTGMIISTHPPATIILSILFGYEVFQWNVIAGTALIITALWIAQKRVKKPVSFPEI